MNQKLQEPKTRSDLPKVGLVINTFNTHSPSKKWKVLPVTHDIPLETSTLCPADTQTLDVLCVLVGEDGRTQLRIGCCDTCGYVGYIDRPSDAWVTEYYLKQWQKDEERDLTRVHGSRYTRAALPILETHGVSKTHGVCEIGCGYGFDLQAFKEAGYTPLVGTENSERRARIAHERYGVVTLTGPFESQEVQDAIRVHAPYGVIYSAHVLEHTRHPETVIAAAAELQKEGGMFVLAVPDVAIESPMNILFFLPHLHTFSHSSITRLLATHGYALVDGPRTLGAGLFVIAQKTVGLQVASGPQSGYTARTYERFVRHLRIHSLKKTSLLSWFLLGSDTSVLVPAWLPIREDGFIYRAVAHFVRTLAHKPGAVVNITNISPLDSATRRTQYPIEISFSGPVELFIK